MNWTVIKNFGKVKYFNISYAVLIIVPLLASTFVMMKDKWGYDIEVPSKVKSLYVASILYAIGIAIYQYRCPAIIKEYETRQDFINKNLEIFKNKAPDLKFFIVIAQLNKSTQEKSYNELIALYSEMNEEKNELKKTQLQLKLDEKLLLLYPGSVQAHLEKKFDIANNQGPFYFWTSGLLYCSATLIVIILLVIRTLLVFNN